MPSTGQVSGQASLEALLSQKKALDEQIKAARAARCVKAGETPGQAVDAVLDGVRAALFATEQERAE